MPSVLGVDACRAGWVGIVLDGGRPVAFFAPTIAELTTMVEDVEVIAIDIPIGLPDDGVRRADELAREAAGPRRNSVFTTPVRQALECDDYPEALRLHRERTAGTRGFSKQAFALRTRIREVDTWIRNQQIRVVEAHPELSFAELAGAPLDTGKATWAGVERRRALLADAGVHLARDLGPAGRFAGVDDVLDAAAAAWTARRVAAGTARSLPDPPQRYGDGLPAAIWI